MVAKGNRIVLTKLQVVEEQNFYSAFSAKTYLATEQGSNKVIVA